MDNMLDRIRAGEMPDHAKGALVKGLLPLEGEVLITALHIVCSQTPALLADARTTFQGMPTGVKRSYFENRKIEGEIAGYFLKEFPLETEVKQILILNPMTPAAAIAEAAPTIEPELLDLTVNNQVKILEDPSIIDKLRENSGLTINQKQKLDEYGRLLLKSEISSAEELEGMDIKEVEAQAIADAKEFVGAFGMESGPVKKTSTEGRRAAKQAPASTSPEPTPEPEKTETHSAKQAPAQASVEEEPTKKKSILERLSNMSIPQKVQAAIKGDREVRTNLVRDSNKLVCCAVIKSPRITEAEVEFYATLRNVQTDVLRLIAMNREWILNYKIIHSLIKNPRTPLAYTTKMLSRLNKKDLRNLERDRNVPEALRKLSKRMSRGMA